MKKQRYLLPFILTGLMLFGVAHIYGQKVVSEQVSNVKPSYLLAVTANPYKTLTDPPVGNYPCYYYGYNYSLTSSSLTEISILPKQRMKIVGETVPFRLSGSILILSGGEFDGLTAHYKIDSDGKSAVVFIRKENEAKGYKIDVSDTWCYLEK